MDKKWLLYGGGAVVALLAGVWVYSAVGNSANAAPVDSSLGMGYQPVSYSSGTGTVPLDSSALAGSGQSSMANLQSLLDFQTAQAGVQQAYQDRALTISRDLGLANIEATTRINTMNTQANTTGVLASLAAALNQSVVSAKATSAVTGQITGNGLDLKYTAEQITGKSQWNTVLQGPNNMGITLANGQQIKG